MAGERAGRPPSRGPGAGKDPPEASSGPDPFREWAGDGAGTLDRSLGVVRFLRAHCPWDRAQTPRSLIPYLLEESHEVVDAIREGDSEALEGELGDLLLNVAFQIVLAEEEERFGAREVVARLEEKMRDRHPHLFGLGERVEWEELKARELGGEGVLAGLAAGLDPLLRAHRIQEKVSGVGFDWDDTGGAWSKVAEELEEVRDALETGGSEEIEEELGDLLFAVVNLTRLAGAHADSALDRANRKFHRRFVRLESVARERGVKLGEATLEELDAIWDELKEEERDGGAQ